MFYFNETKLLVVRGASEVRAEGEECFINRLAYFDNRLDPVFEDEWVTEEY